MANVRIDRKTIKKIDLLHIPGGMVGADVWERYQPDYMMNLSQIDMDTKTPLTNMLDEGNRVGYLFSAEGIGIKGDGQICWAKQTDPGLRDFIGGAPTLLKDGQPYVDWGNKYSSYLDGSHRRGVLGFNGQYLYLLCTDYPLSIPATADTAKGLGMTHAISGDGGGSLHLQSKKKTFVESTRKLSTWLLVYLKTEDEGLTIREQFIEKGKRRPGTMIEPTSLTIHSTGNPKSTAQNERDFLASKYNNSATSWHVVVDQKEAIQAVPFDEKANHAGGAGEGNMSSIGLEICESGDREKTLRNAIIVAAQILDRFGWTVENLKQHYDWNSKNCPRILRDTGRWEWFKSEVEKEMKKKEVTNTTVTCDGQTYAAVIIDGTTYAPVRALAESLGRSVHYDATTKQVTIK